ncbi:MAG TPA: 16S rRNA (adenine(1518)-N(6)/adenine(1519)-N(6))-dimethyltransferase RsmA [Thermoanaerobaculia bacterium]|nr:16S rRNA (adenine(1518)-N(6)/adenine(1519)-N(6))-dimethyltransferase RsmA [Thermoanaerobaculia bacterium]
MEPRLKKALGQHHLVDGRLCQPLLSYLRPGGHRVLEVGPGGGVLTRELMAAGARVWAWELDPDWAFALRSAWTGGWPPGAEPSAPALVVGDALAIPWHRLPAPTLVAGNLPYGIATALIARMLRHPERVPRAAFLVQKEVADRLVAGPGDPAYGALSVLVAARAEVRLLARVRAGSFRPPPKVDGAFVGVRPVAPALPAAAMDGFEGTVKAAFARRRKTLRNSLGGAWGREAAEGALARAGILPGARAEDLAVADFVRLTEAHRQG